MELCAATCVSTTNGTLYLADFGPAQEGPVLHSHSQQTRSAPAVSAGRLASASARMRCADRTLACGLERTKERKIESMRLLVLPHLGFVHVPLSLESANRNQLLH